MKKILLTGFVAFGFYASAQIDVTATAGTPTATYTTLKGAFDAINAGTHQGSINLNVTANTTETATAVLNAVTTYTSLTIKPTVTASISGAVASNPLVKILGSNVTIDGSTTVGGTTKDLTINNTSATSPSVFFMGSPTSTAPLTNVIVKNAVFVNGATGTTNFIIANGSTSAGYFNNITVQNNDIKTGFNGIFVSANTAAGNGNNLLITGNTVGTNVLQNGIVVSGVGGISTISNNTIAVSNPTAGTSSSNAGSLGINISSGTNNASVFGNMITAKNTAVSGTNYATGIAVAAGSTNVSTKVYNNTILEISGFLSFVNSSGIYLSGATPNVSIYMNKVSGLKNTNGGLPMQGIVLGSTSTTANALVYNNVISDVLATAGGQVSGLYAYSGAGYKIYNNTVNLNTSNGENSITTAFYVFGTNVTAANALDVRNNIFSNNKSGGTRYAIYSTAANTVFSNLDYNDYASSGIALGNVGGVDKATLADIQSGFGGNVNSLSISPVFMSATDMHLKTNTNKDLDNKGVSLAAVLTDYDGTTRSATPDMGAYEFTYVAPLVAPNCTTISSPLNAATNVMPNPGMITWAVADGAEGYKVYIGKSSGATDVVNGTMVTGTSYSITLTANTMYYVKVVPYNVNGDATGCAESSFTTGNPVYCAANATASDHANFEKISNVTFAGINNPSTATTGYEDFTSVIGMVKLGQTYPMTVTINKFDTDRTSVWIDYDQDGIFAASEKVDLTSTASATGNVTVPTNAKLGNTRMRVRMVYNSAPAACGDVTYGQTEDYTINVDQFLAVTDINKANVSVYPNPFKSVLKISDIANVKTINVSDASGRIVGSPKVSQELDLSNLSKGVYFVTVSYENGTSKTFKAIKE